MRLPCVPVLLALIAIAAASQATSLQPAYSSKKEMVVAHLGAGARLMLRTVKLSAADRSKLAADWGLQAVDDSLSFVLTRDTAGAVAGAIAFMYREISHFHEKHSIGVALDKEGAVAGVALIGTHGAYGRLLGTRAFLAQFAKKRPAKGYAQADVDAVSGATESCRLVVDMVNTAKAVFCTQVLAQPARQ